MVPLPPPLQGLPARPPRARAIWALISGRLDEVDPLLTDAERSLDTADQSHEPPITAATGGLANIPGTIAQLRAELARHRGDAEHAIRFAQQALAHAGEDER